MEEILRQTLQPEVLTRQSLNTSLSLEEILAEHGLGGHLFHHKELLVGSGIQINPWCEKIWKRQRQRNIVLFSELQKLTKRMSEEKVEVIALKGLSLLTTIYKNDWGVRPITDIDILVSQGQIDSVRKHLFKHGYNLQKESKFFANEFKEVWYRNSEIGEISIEIHTKLFANEPKQMSWSRVYDAEKAIYRLQPEHEIIHLIGHLAHQHTFIKLFWLADIDLYIRSTKINWQIVHKLAQELSLEKSLDATLWCLHHLLRNSSAPKPVSQRWKHLLSWKQLLHTRNNRWNYFALKHALKDNWTEALKYDLLWSLNRLTKFKNQEL